jgi:hypothetical protein
MGAAAKREDEKKRRRKESRFMSFCPAFTEIRRRKLQKKENPHSLEVRVLCRSP